MAQAVRFTEDGNGRLDLRLRVYPDGRVWVHSEQVPDCNFSRTSIERVVEDIELMLHEAWRIVTEEGGKTNAA